MSKKILSVKLLDLGLKGVSIVHLQSGIRKSMKFREKHKVDYDAPANAELLGHFDGLKQNVIELCMLDSDIAIEDVKVVEARISPDGEFFQIVGAVRSVGVAEVKLTTPRISNDNSYIMWGDCMTKVRNLFSEAKSYITEKKVMDTNQMVMMFAERDAKFMENHEGGIQGMDEAAQLEYARTILEKRGAIIIEQEFTDPGDQSDAEDVEVEEVSEAKTGKVINIKQKVEIPMQPKLGFGN